PPVPFSGGAFRLISNKRGSDRVAISPSTKSKTQGEGSTDEIVLDAAQSPNAPDTAMALSRAGRISLAVSRRRNYDFRYRHLRMRKISPVAAKHQTLIFPSMPR